MSVEICTSLDLNLTHFPSIINQAPNLGISPRKDEIIQGKGVMIWGNHGTHRHVGKQSIGSNNSTLFSGVILWPGYIFIHYSIKPIYHSAIVSPLRFPRRSNLPSVLYAIVPISPGTKAAYTKVSHAVRGVQRKYL